MQKTELLHLHSLFAELQRHLEREGAIDGPLEPYESMDVRPAHAHRSKDRHREAVMALASGIADELAVNSKYADDGSSEVDDGSSEADDGSSETSDGSSAVGDESSEANDADAMTADG